MGQIEALTGRNVDDMAVPFPETEPWLR